ncbi:GNAT family N-acetyltransferase [Thermosediminibacter oceani]|uniref:GCN5-related N-acetyltransferase n=1 Tax=Thermosediminibacter oceani (strain ATCC BAA-1034 / DSM 16646 / JW/IW-1228P) TaxID=555079 RepID=D9RZ39_THEOJ|nr:GNAT family N-acetyltransferase [Thermosediminibacter oceani]ADL08593.1 GCN5-related N-acetyltransferase [Thermosediminibacter oceani DSM 16646]
MQVYSFKELTQPAKKQLYNYITKSGWNHYVETYEEMLQNYGGVLFNFGESHFSLWEEGEILGTMGCITKEVTHRGEAFITGINIDNTERYADCFKILVEKCERYCISKGARKISLGITPDLEFLRANIESFGYRYTHRILVMKYCCGEDVSTQNDISREIFFEMLSNQNKDSFREVHNEAFRHSPNAALLNDEDMNGMLEACKENPGLKGLCLYNGRPAGIYDLKLKNKIGWIETIGVYPDFQGHGIGKALLKKSVDILRASGAEEIRLFVIDVNQRAYKLYKKFGFEDEGVRSLWFRKAPF